MSARTGLSERILLALSEPKTAAHIARELGEPTSNVLNRLEGLSYQRFVEVTDQLGQKTHRFGRRPRLWRKLSDHETERRREFESARRIVERAGFVLVPRRA